MHNSYREEGCLAAGCHAHDDILAPKPYAPGYFPEALRQASVVRAVPEGDAIFHQGTAVSTFYRMISGSVRLTRTATPGAVATLQRANPGDWLIEPGPCDDLHGCTAVAACRSVILAIPAKQFRLELGRDAAFASAWGMEMADTAKLLLRRLERLSLRRVQERIVHYLATESEGHEATVYRTASMSAWARHLNIAPETLSRIVTEMRAQGQLERKGRRFKLLRAPATNAATSHKESLES